MRVLRADGNYTRSAPNGNPPRRSQTELLALAAANAEAADAEAGAPHSFDLLADAPANGEPPRDAQRRKKKKRTAPR
jgi:hypothetical protein